MYASALAFHVRRERAKLRFFRPEQYNDFGWPERFPFRSQDSNEVIPITKIDGYLSLEIK
jgi:hypothetical protein